VLGGCLLGAIAWFLCQAALRSWRRDSKLSFPWLGMSTAKESRVLRDPPPGDEDTPTWRMGSPDWSGAGQLGDAGSRVCVSTFEWARGETLFRQNKRFVSQEEPGALAKEGGGGAAGKHCGREVLGCPYRKSKGRDPCRGPTTGRKGDRTAQRPEGPKVSNGPVVPVPSSPC
jgi:hypothetical protein